MLQFFLVEIQKSWLTEIRSQKSSGFFLLKVFSAKFSLLFSFKDIFTPLFLFLSLSHPHQPKHILSLLVSHTHTHIHYLSVSRAHTYTHTTYLHHPKPLKLLILSDSWLSFRFSFTLICCFSLSASSKFHLYVLILSLSQTFCLYILCCCFAFGSLSSS